MRKNEERPWTCECAQCAVLELEMKEKKRDGRMGGKEKENEDQLIKSKGDVPKNGKMKCVRKKRWG